MESSKAEIIDNQEEAAFKKYEVAPEAATVVPSSTSDHMPFREFRPIFRKAVSRNTVRKRELSEYLATQTPKTISLISKSLEFTSAYRCGC